MPSENTPTQKQTAKNVHTNLHKLVIIHILHTLHILHILHRRDRTHIHPLFRCVTQFTQLQKKLVITHCSINKTLRIIV